MKIIHCADLHLDSKMETLPAEKSKARREEILQAGSEIRKQIQHLTDEESFIEFDSYSFSKNEFYEGV